MPGKLVLGVVGELRREDEGEYVCPRCTVFGLDQDEVQILLRSGFKMTDCNKDEEGVEVKNSIFKVLRGLGKELGYELQGDPATSEAPGGRTTLIYTLVKEI